MAKYDFSALPVLGVDRRLLGVITADDVMDVLTQEGTEDMQKLAALEPTEEGYFQTSFWTFMSATVVVLVLSLSVPAPDLVIVPVPAPAEEVISVVLVAGL